MKQIIEILAGIVMALLIVGGLFFAAARGQQKFKSNCDKQNGTVVSVGDGMLKCLAIKDGKLVEL